MGDAIEKKSGGEGQEQTAKVDMTKYVSKDDYERLSSSTKELESKLEEAKLSLLDPEYIAFKESEAKRKSGKVEKSILDGIDRKDMTPDQLLAAAVEKVKSELLPEYDRQLSATRQTLSDVLAVLEVQECEKRFKDFDDFREATRKILETSKTPLTVEQAYKLAKTEDYEKHPDKYQKPQGTEKPTSSVPSEAVVPKNFKNANEAGLDAWDRVVGKGKDTL